MSERDATSKRSKRQRKLMEDCFVLLVSLVLSEPHTTVRQRKMFGGLIDRLRKELVR